MRKITLIASIFFFFIAAPNFYNVSAANFTFDKTTVKIGAGETFQVTISEDVGTEKTNSSQLYIIYDSTLFEAQSVTAGSFFPVISNNITPGKVFIVGYVDGSDSSLYKTGKGELAVVTFKGLKDGSGTLTFDCRSGASDSSQIIKYNDANAANIITCSENNSLAVTVGTGSSSGPTPTGDEGDGDSGSTLPRSGLMDHFNETSVTGIGLFLIGVILKIALL